MSGDMLRVRAVGDICLDGVDGDPFERVAGELHADIVFGNLECCFSTSGTAADKNVVFNADARMARWLKPFDVLCLANNHTLDFGPDGLADTIAVLDSNRLAYSGAGRTAAEAEAVTWLDANSVRVAVLSSADASGGAADRHTVSVLSVKALAERIAAVRAEADVVIASYHGGIELDTVPGPSIVRGLRALVDAGADIVLAHHPHVLQPAEVYRDRVIIYSLGNFVFDNRRYGNDAGLASMTTILDVDLALDGKRPVSAGYTYIPIEISDDFKPGVAVGERAERIRGHLAGLEAELARIDGDAVDVKRLENMTRELHQKSLGTIVRYGVRHMKDFTLKELIVGAVLAVRSLFQRRTR